VAQGLVFRLFVDEVQIAMTGLFWRECFSSIGSLRSDFGFTVPMILMSASLPVHRLEAVKDFWSLGCQPLTVVSEEIRYGASIELRVDRVQSHTLTALVDCIRRYKINKEAELDFVPERIMVLVPSILGAAQIERDLKHLTRNQQDEISVGLVTSETPEEEMRRVVDNCTIIVCTTILSSSVNIAKLDLILIYSTTYSMSDLVQAIGRVGRQGQKAKAILLFNNDKHEAIFGAKGTQQYFKNQMGPVMWAQKSAFDAGLAALYSPAGVQSFAMSENQCRREYIGKLFGGPSSQVQSCLDDLPRNVSFCDVCRANIDEASQCLMTEERIESDIEEDEEHEEGFATPVKPTAATQPESEESSGVGLTQLAVPNAPRKIDPRRELSADDLRQSQGLLVPTPVSRDAARLIFQSIYEQLEDLTKPNCIMCDGISCNGFKVNLTTMCKKRSDMVFHRSPMVCFSCGGPHRREKCSFRPSGGRPQVPGNVGRCYRCFLPQHAPSGYSFHNGEAGLSGGSQSQNAICTQRGDQVFALLSVFYWSRRDLYDRFMVCHDGKVTLYPPHHMDRPVGGQYGFPGYWTWLWEICQIGHSVRNLDVVLSFMLQDLSVFV
jgi:hypothetical protein